MDSINQQQPEDNRKDLQGAEAGKKIHEIVQAANVCFFCTDISYGKPFSTRPMSVQKVDDDGTCWFLCANDSDMVKHINAETSVQLLFRESGYAGFLNMYGQATLSQDKEKIKELWEPMVKTWFTEGVDDPRITVVQFKPSSGYYWDTKHGAVIAFAKQLVGAAIGKTLDDSIEGTLSV